MKNLKQFLGLAIMALVVLSSCGKEEVALEDVTSLEALTENELMDWETLMDTPSRLIDINDLETEIIESTAEERSICCNMENPYHLSSGTNRFRTEISQDPGYYIRYTVYHRDYSNPPNITSTKIGDFEYAYTFQQCTAIYDIVDLDAWVFDPIIIGDNYIVYSYLYDKSNSNGCFDYNNSNSFTGQ